MDARTKKTHAPRMTERKRKGGRRGRKEREVSCVSFDDDEQKEKKKRGGSGGCVAKQWKQRGMVAVDAMVWILVSWWWEEEGRKYCRANFSNPWESEGVDKGYAPRLSCPSSRTAVMFTCRTFAQ
jgi:hypothetical protein